MLATLCVEYGRTPSEIRALPRRERVFMFEALAWKKETTERAGG